MQLAMEAEYQKLRAIPSFNLKIETSAAEGDEIPRYDQKLRAVSSFKHLISRQGSSDHTDEQMPRYQSLKDVMTDPNGADAEIAIRNELVKHAASAYVLSATIITPPNRDDGGGGSRMFERIKICCLGFLSCWHIHVGLPFEALCWPLVDFLYRLLNCLT